MSFSIGKAHQDDQRLHNLFYRKSKLESVNETSALLSGFAIVSFGYEKSKTIFFNLSKYLT